MSKIYIYKIYVGYIISLILKKKKNDISKKKITGDS